MKKFLRMLVYLCMSSAISANASQNDIIFFPRNDEFKKGIPYVQCEAPSYAQSFGIFVGPRAVLIPAFQSETCNGHVSIWFSEKNKLDADCETHPLYAKKASYKDRFHHGFGLCKILDPNFRSSVSSYINTDPVTLGTMVTIFSINDYGNLLVQRSTVENASDDEFRTYCEHSSESDCIIIHKTEQLHPILDLDHPNGAKVYSFNWGTGFRLNRGPNLSAPSNLNWIKSWAMRSKLLVNGISEASR